MKKTRRAYTRPRLFVHGTVEDLTLQKPVHKDPKPFQGNDGCGIGIGNGFDGSAKFCGIS